MGTAPSQPTSTTQQVIAQGDELRKAGQTQQAIEAYLQAASSTEVPEAALCLKIARCYSQIGDDDNVRHWAMASLDDGDDFLTWQGVTGLVKKYFAGSWSGFQRQARVAILGSYTTVQFKQMLAVAAIKYGIQLELYESDFGQYQQDIVDPDSRLYRFDPQFVILATHAGEVHLPDFTDDPTAALERETARWVGLWQRLRQRSKAKIIQHNFALEEAVAMGHLATRLAGSRYNMMQQLNHRLAMAAGNDVAMVDCQRLSSLIGQWRWFDPKYWNLSKQAVSLQALPLLARHTAAVLASELGLSRKCLVLDLDNTLWGGVIGEDGMGGIKLGQGSPVGEAYIAFQEYLLQLKNKGVILTVNSKNNDADAREVFQKHPEMRIKLDDIAVFVANWQPKPQNVQHIAKVLNIGIDSMVFVDDNPVERQAMRQFLPQVDTIVMPTDPSLYVRTLSNYLLFETSSFTREDAARAQQYHARAQIAELEQSAGSIEDFYRSLQMKATVKPFDRFSLPRIAQLLGKTNQFNLTTRRHGAGELEKFMADPACVHYALTLRDRFANHGLVSLIIAFKRGDILDIDTWLMSCRVIGRTVEAELLSQLTHQALAMGCKTIQGTYIPTAKNAMVQDIFAKFGFTRTAEDHGTTVWQYDLTRQAPITNDFIEKVGRLDDEADTQTN
ncbi:MAG: HAD family hydrolase [Phycisphaerales bacterium]|nr:HAD family hydrolase [Phycisphaerales bacterium]